MQQTSTDNSPAKRQRSIRRNAWLLIVVAVAVYGAFILASVMRSQGGA